MNVNLGLCMFKQLKRNHDVESRSKDWPSLGLLEDQFINTYFNTALSYRIL